MKNIVLGVGLAMAIGVTGCKTKQSPAQDVNTVVTVDGSSTVFPLSEAVAEDFQKQHQARVTIAVSGTGGGFKRFCHGDVAVTGASRPITANEREACAKQGVTWVELPVAFDGIAIVVHPSNTWVNTLTVESLRDMWRPEAQGKVTQWKQLNAAWPDKELHLFGPGVDSGTYDYFTKAIVGVEHASRGDFTSSEDDNVLVQGVARDPMGLGYFGYSYYLENRDKLKLVAIAPAVGAAAVLPSPETIGNDTYKPLSRPLFIYVSLQALKNPAVAAYVNFYVKQAPTLAAQVGFTPLSSQQYAANAQKLPAAGL